MPAIAQQTADLVSSDQTGSAAAAQASSAANPDTDLTDGSVNTVDVAVARSAQHRSGFQPSAYLGLPNHEYCHAT
jgi:hypothetical protein